MAIQKSKAFVTSDNKVFLTQEEAQWHEIENIFNGAGMGVDEKLNEPVVANAVAAVMNHREELLAILSTRKPRVAKAAKPAKSNRKTQPVQEAA